MPKKEFTVTEVMMLQEKTLKEIRVITEMQQHQDEKIKSQGEKLDAVYEMVAKNSEDITVMRSILKSHSKDLQEIKTILKDMRLEIARIKQDIELIKSVIARKVDRELYDKLEERVRALEQKLFSIS